MVRGREPGEDPVAGWFRIIQILFPYEELLMAVVPAALVDWGQ